MQRVFQRTLAAILAGACVAASPQEGSNQFGRRGEENVRFGEICRSSTGELPATLEVFRFQLEAGGRTCFADGEGILFVPKRQSGCPRLDWPGFGGATVVSGAVAEAELRRCLALLAPSGGSTGVLIYRPTPHAVDFPQFGLDLGGLVAHDMLPVTHFGAANGLVCMEAPEPRRVADRITAAGIAGVEEFTIEFGRGSCAELTYERTGHVWPASVPRGN